MRTVRCVFCCECVIYPQTSATCVICEDSCVCALLTTSTTVDQRWLVRSHAFLRSFCQIRLFAQRFPRRNYVSAHWPPFRQHPRECLNHPCKYCFLFYSEKVGSSCSSTPTCPERIENPHKCAPRSRLHNFKCCLPLSQARSSVYRMMCVLIVCACVRLCVLKLYAYAYIFSVIFGTSSIRCLVVCAFIINATELMYANWSEFELKTHPQ